MRQAQLRTLNAMGYTLGDKLKITGLRSYRCVNSLGHEVLLVRGELLGPSWPSIAWYLEQRGEEFKLIEAGGVWLVVEKKSATSELLAEFIVAAKHSSQQEVYLPQVGFATSEVRKRFEARLLVAPALILMLTLSIAFFRPSEPPIESTLLEQETQISCALDLASDEFDRWLEQRIFDALDQSKDEVILQTELGLLNLITEGSIGSTKRLAGYLECQDGRSLELHLRADSSGKGSLIQLGEKLDP
jgi:hypothetical protein